MASTGTKNQISLRIMVDKDKNRVLFAEAGKDFVDIVLSFLTMPLGTIARLVNKDSTLKVFQLGSITSLYQSVQNLDAKNFCTDTCKHMLLHPRNPMETYFQNLKINIDDTEPTEYFVCEESSCQMTNVVVSTFRNQTCKCGRIMSGEIARMRGASDRMMSGEITRMMGDLDRMMSGEITRMRGASNRMISGEITRMMGDFDRNRMMSEEIGRRIKTGEIARDGLIRVVNP